MNKETGHLQSGEHTIIDVRETWEYEEQCHPAAINIPLNFIALKLAEIRALPQPLLLYCNNGQKSEKAAQMLITAGINCKVVPDSLENFISYQKTVAP